MTPAPRPPTTEARLREARRLLVVAAVTLDRAERVWPLLTRTERAALVAGAERAGKAAAELVDEGGDGR